MSNVRIYALSSTATTPNFDDYFVLDGVTCGTRNILATTALTATTGFGPLNIAGNLTVTGTISTASTIYANNFYTASSFPVTLSGVCVISNNICATGNICGAVLYSGGAQVCTSTTTAGSGAFASPTTAGTLFGSTTYSNLSSNTFLGLSAGNANSTGCYNTYIGTNAGNGVTTGSNNTFIGNNVGANLASCCCYTTIIGSGSNCIMLSGGSLYLATSGVVNCNFNPATLNISGFLPNCNCLNNLYTTIAGNNTLYCIYCVGNYTWTVPTLVSSASALLVGGGGAGGGNQTYACGGGGGAGGVVCVPLTFTSFCTYCISVGAGGTCNFGGGSGGSSTYICGPGITCYVACGGGGGGNCTPGGNGGGGAGGSGGGGGGGNSGQGGGSSNQPTYPGAVVYGNSGGSSGQYVGSGGGGAGAAGNSGSPSGVNGVNGIYNSLTNFVSAGQLSSGNYYVAGGGAGAGFGNAGCAGGLGGGGCSCAGSTSTPAGSGSFGGGGGGGANRPGGNGGGGLAIIVYNVACSICNAAAGSIYVTCDTCTIWYYNGTNWLNRGLYNNSYNVACCNLYTGYGALSSSFNNTTSTTLSTISGYGNIGLGGFAGQNITVGNFNTILGFNAGRCLTTGVNNTIIGAGADLGSNLSNTILLSAGTQNLYVSSGCLFVNSNIYSSGTASTSSFNVLSAVNLSAFNGFINTLSAFNLSATNVYSNSAAFNNLSAGSIISTNLKSTSAFLNFLNVAYTSNTPTNYGALNVGSGYGYSAPGQIATFAGNDNVETYLAVQNTNSSASAYAALTLTNDSNYANYVELAINSTNYNYASAGLPNSTFDAPSAASLYNYGGDLVIGTYSNKGLHFITNAGAATTDSLLISATNQGNVVSTTGLICGGTLYSGGLQVCTSTATAGTSSFNVLSAVNLSAFNGFINTLSAFNLSATNVNSNTINMNSFNTCYGTITNATCTNGLITTLCSLSSTTPGTGLQYGLYFGTVSLFNNGTYWTTNDASFFNNITNGQVITAHGTDNNIYTLKTCGVANVVAGTTTITSLPTNSNPSISNGTCLNAFYYNGLAFTSCTSLTANNNVQSLSANNYYNINGTGVATACTTFAGNTLTITPSGTYNVGNNLNVYNNNSIAINTVNPDTTQVLRNGTLSYNYNGTSGWLLSGGNLTVAGSVSALTPTICGFTNNSDTAIGVNALNTLINPGINSNTAIGFQALVSNTTGACNTAIGWNALFSNTTGICNTAIGYFSLGSNTTGIDNTGIGKQTLVNNTTGCQNVAIGFFSSLLNTTGCCNVAIGSCTLLNNCCGCCNVAIGFNADNQNTTGSNRIAIGNAALPTCNSSSHTIWGNSSNNVCNCVYVAWSNVSDCRDKTNIAPLPTNLGLEFVKQLNPVTYNWDNRQTYVRECNFLYGQKDGTLAGKKQHYGFIAQELKTVVDSLSVKFDGLGYDETQDAYRLTYEELIAPVVAAIKELDAHYASIEARLSALENK